jgi:hypothetical protein
VALFARASSSARVREQEETVWTSGVETLTLGQEGRFWAGILVNSDDPMVTRQREPRDIAKRPQMTDRRDGPDKPCSGRHADGEIESEALRGRG